MSPRGPKACSDIGCTILVHDGGSRCPEHRKVWASPRTASSRRTGTRQFNATIRPRVLERDGGLCRVMGPGCARLASQVHHVKEVSAGGSDDLDNLISVCEPCHKHITAASAGGSKAVDQGGPRRRVDVGWSNTMPPGGPRRQVNAGGTTASDPGGPRQEGQPKYALPQVIWLKGNG
jgi:5-methylcytosine-specific restriction protein A